MLERIYALAEHIATEATGAHPDWAALADSADELASLIRSAACRDANAPPTR